MKRTATRIDFEGFEDGLHAMYALHEAVAASGLEPALLELVKFRVSQVNGCAFCLDMHSKDARAAGETEQRLYGVSAWRETPYYTPRERAALALAEAMTSIGEGGVPDAVLDDAEAQFDREELRVLLYAIVEINAWNRLAIASRMAVGNHRPAAA